MFYQSSPVHVLSHAMKFVPQYCEGSSDEKPHTAELNDTAIPHFKIQITEIPLE